VTSRPGSFGQDDLTDELRELGEHLRVPDPPEIAAAVRARLAGRPAARPAGGALPSPLRPYRWAVVVAAAVVAALLLAVAPPARAAVDRILRFAGIEFTTDTGRPGSARLPSLPSSPAPLPTEPTSLGQARVRVGFPIAVPARLGMPDQVVLLDAKGDRPRVVMLIWHPGTPQEIQVDEYADLGQPYFAKQAITQANVQMVDVGPDMGIWVPTPHALTYIDADGKPWTDATRLAGPTLVWQHNLRIYRLEGVPDLTEALAIARSVG
jgi:hypothetical protein